MTWREELDRLLAEANTVKDAKVDFSKDGELCVECGATMGEHYPNGCPWYALMVPD